MKVKDKNLGELVEVVSNLCLKASCYWPRPDPGVFTQGRGYSSRSGGSRGYLCGTREIHGCPYNITCKSCNSKNPESVSKCRKCSEKL